MQVHTPPRLPSREQLLMVSVTSLSASSHPVLSCLTCLLIRLHKLCEGMDQDGSSQLTGAAPGA